MLMVIPEEKKNYTKGLLQKIRSVEYFITAHIGTILRVVIFTDMV